jgi:hypothetical protein
MAEHIENISFAASLQCLLSIAENLEGVIPAFLAIMDWIKP